MTPYPDIDVKQLLAEIYTVRDKTGKRFTDQSIADALETTGATISRLRRGKVLSTNSKRAIAIANYHAQVCQGKA